MEDNDPRPINHTPGQWQDWLRAKWKFVLAAVVVIVCLFALLLHSGNTESTTLANLTTVPVARVTRTDLAQEQTFEAEFRPYQEIDLRPEVAGFVRSMKVDIGDRVQAGDVLANLEIPELSEDIDRAEAQERRNEMEIKRAAAAYDDAHLAYTRLVAVNQSKPNLIAQQDLDTAQAHDAAAEAALAVAKQEVDVSKAEADKLKAMLDYCKVTAPFAGVITKRYADEGTLVQGGITSGSVGMPLVRLSQNDRLRLDFPVSVSYVERIKLGDPVEIRIPAMGKVISGRIARFTRKVATDTRTMEAEVDVPNPDLALTPGIYAIAALKLDQRANVLTVPTEAVANPKAPTVFVLNHANVIEERPVTLGLETADRIEIVAGLNENELVMLGSRALVRPGQTVEPKITELGSRQ